MSKTYNGHRNWNQWNVSLWINNDEGLYNMARSYVRQCSNRNEAASAIVDALDSMGQSKTPDGATCNFTAVRAALVGI